jgi:type II secretory pathway component GspD/PulD (secretin)
MLLFFLAPAALAQGTLEVISLRHRTVEQVLPVLRPLLEPGGVMSGQSNQLIVRTSARNLADIRAALNAIDTPARRLLISVRFDSAGEMTRGGVEAGGAISSRGSRLEARIEDTRALRDERVDQRVQVLEGGRAVIATGESRPLRQQQVVRSPTATVISESTVVQDTATGFEVVPRLSGSTVFLEIAPQRQSFASGDSGAIQAERAASTVSGRLGEWIELGGTGRGSAGSDRGALSARELRTSESRLIWVKVEEVR